MDRDAELDHILSTALALEEDYLLKDKCKTLQSGTHGTLPDVLPAKDARVPPPGTKVLQEAIMELYNSLGIPQEAQISRILDPNILSGNSSVIPTRDMKYQHFNNSKRPCDEAELMGNKRPRNLTAEPLSCRSANMPANRTDYCRKQTFPFRNQIHFNHHAGPVRNDPSGQMPNIPQPTMQVWFQNGKQFTKFQGVQGMQVPAAGGTPNYIYGVPKYPNVPGGTQIPASYFLHPK